MSHTREIRLGWAPAVFAALAILHSLLLLPLNTALYLAQVHSALAVSLLVTAGLVPPVAWLAVLTTRRLRRVQRGTRGRARLLLLASMSLLHMALAIVISIVGGIGATAAALGAGLDGAGQVFGDAVASLSSPHLQLLVVTCLVVLCIVQIVLLGAAISSWFLVPRRIRFWTWLMVDAITTGAFGWAAYALPFAVPDGHPELRLRAALAMGITVLFAVRVAARLVPLFLRQTERLGFEAMVAARYLRARKSDFLALIGILAILSVTLSSCALVVTLSVMGGFRDDLKRKILGNNAHVVIDRSDGTFDAWEPVLDRVRSTAGVAAAAPYVSGEVMMTSASNLAGAVLRGIDPAHVSDVVDLRRNLRHGRIEYLEHPEQLLDVPPEETGAQLPLQIPTLRRGDEEPPPPTREHSSPVRDLDELLGPTDHANIDAFLREDLRPDPGADVLPGVIIGQELARSLRLYVGDEVNIVSPLGDLGPAGPVPKSRPFRIAGIFYSGMYEYDMKYIYVTLPRAQRFLNVDNGISGIEIRVDQAEQAPAVAVALRGTLGREELRVRDWQELNQSLFGALQLEKLAMFITLGIAILVAGFCVFGTLSLMVQEKAPQVGVLRALGTRREGIVRVFLLEGLLIGAFGSSLGLGLGFVACFAAENFGIEMNPEVYYIDKLPVHVDGLEFLWVGIASILVCLLATVFPAVLASRVRPVDAFRYE